MAEFKIELIRYDGEHVEKIFKGRSKLDAKEKAVVYCHENGFKKVGKVINNIERR